MKGDLIKSPFLFRADRAAIEPPFLWILSKGCAKESISPSGANTRLKRRRDSDLIIYFFKPLHGYLTSVNNATMIYSHTLMDA